MAYNKLILVEQYFRWNDHDFNKDARFTFIEKETNKKQPQQQKKKPALNYIITIIEKFCA